MDLTADNLAELLLRTKTTPAESVNEPNISLPDWHQHWPFPQFQSPRKHSSVRVASKGKKTKERESEKSDDASSSDNSEPVAYAVPHELSIDHDLEVSSILMRQNASREEGNSSLFVPRPLTSMSSTQQRLPYQKDIISMLTIASNLVHTSNESPYALRNINITWLLRRHAVVPPTMLLNLENMQDHMWSKVRAEGLCTDKFVLVNSPRSVVALMRTSVTVEQLQKKADSDFRSYAERQAHEAQRSALKSKCLSEYRRICDNLSVEEIIAFCRCYDVARPHSVLAQEGLKCETDSFFDLTANAAQRRLRTLMNASERQHAAATQRLDKVLEKEKESQRALSSKREQLGNKVQELRRLAKQRKERQDLFHKQENYRVFQAQTAIYGKHDHLYMHQKAREDATVHKGVIARVLSATVNKRSDQFKKDLAKQSRVKLQEALKVVALA